MDRSVCLMVLTEMMVRQEQKCYPDCSKDPYHNPNPGFPDAVALRNQIFRVEPGQIAVREVNAIPLNGLDLFITQFSSGRVRER